MNTLLQNLVIKQMQYTYNIIIINLRYTTIQHNLKFYDFFFKKTDTHNVY